MGLRLNQGYTELKILDGNVRYVKLDGFIWKKGVTPQVVADVARFLGGGDAAIIDLRQNGGGSGEAVQALVSYFLPPDGQLLMTFHDGMTGKTQRNHVLSKLGAPRLVGKPLWVLISPMTASAAEEFSDHVKEFKLGTLVGRTTAGGANNNTVFPVAPGFLASVSTGRPVHGLSGTGEPHRGAAPGLCRRLRHPEDLAEPGRPHLPAGAARAGGAQPTRPGSLRVWKRSAHPVAFPAGGRPDHRLRDVRRPGRTGDGQADRLALESADTERSASIVLPWARGRA